MGGNSDAEFDWYEDETVVVRPQSATAVYFNKRGELVIRQERAWNDDEDSVVILSRDAAVAVALRLLDLAEHHEPAQPSAATAEQPPPRDRTAAERQRRYRDRHGHRNVTADRNGGETVTRNGRNGAEPVTADLPFTAPDANGAAA